MLSRLARNRDFVEQVAGSNSSENAWINIVKFAADHK